MARHPILRVLGSVMIVMVAWVAPCNAADGPASSLLEQLGQRVEEFWKHVPKVTCTETVVRARLSDDGKLIVQERNEFDFTMNLQMEGMDLSVQETRLLRPAATKPKDRPKQQVREQTDRSFLSTEGFSILILIFHPHYRASFDFEVLPTETVGGKQMRRIRFVQKEGAPAPSVLQIHGSDFPILWEGTAWINTSDGAVERIQARLWKPLLQAGLTSMESDVHYAPIHFGSNQEQHWLPQSAVVEARTRNQRWRNEHRFSDYRQFQVESKIITGAPVE